MTQTDWSFVASPPDSGVHTRSRCRRPSGWFTFFRVSRFAVLTGVAALAVLVLVVGAQAANTVDNFTGSSTASLLSVGNWSLTALPIVANDAVFTANSGIHPFTAGNLTVGSFDVTLGSGTFTIRNNTSTSTDSILTLGGSGDLGNGVLGTVAGDLLYVASGGTFTLTGPNGGSGSGVLKVALGQSGNFDAVGTLNITAVISGSGFGFTKTGGGTLTLGGVNTFSGNTIISAGTLALSGSGSIVNSACIVIEGSGTFDVSALSGNLTLGAQVLKSPSTAATGTIKAGTSTGLALGATSSLAFPNFSKTTPALTISGGALTLNSSATVSVVIKNSGTPLPAGDYKLISKGTGGSVTFATTAPAVAFNGTGSDGIIGGGVASLQISSGELYLHVAAALLSAQSDIVRASAFTEPANIAYASYQAATGLTTGNSIEMARFTIRDGGAAADADAVGTTLSAITFNVANGAALRRVALFDGSTEIAETAGGTDVTSTA